MHTVMAKGKELVLKYNFRALTEIQDRGISMTNEVEFKMKDIVKIVHIGLRKYQPELTEDNVFDLMDDILEELPLEDLMLIVQEALQQAVGKQKPNPMVKTTQKGKK